jgi:hypothetical protein
VLAGKADTGVRDRDRHAADLIRREVFAKQRRALIIYGENHLFRTGQSLVSLLESNSVIKVFTIANAMLTKFEDLNALQVDARSWPVPSLAIIRGTALDAKQLKYYDAILYLGPPSAITYSRLSSAHCTDTGYLEMRLKRMTGSPAMQEEANQLRQYCAAVARK